MDENIQVAIFNGKLTHLFLCQILAEGEVKAKKHMLEPDLTDTIRYTNKLGLYWAKLSSSWEWTIFQLIYIKLMQYS